MPTQQQNSRRYFIKTYGCQMNVADSAKLAAVLEAAGYTEFKTDDDSSDIRKLGSCDLILINACVVRQNAEDRAAWFVTSMKGLKAINPNLKIGLCGCIVTEPGRDIKKQFPHVDFFIPPNNSDKLAEYLHSSPACRQAGSYIRNSSLSKQVKTGSSFVSIMTGCDNYCSYCVVPYVRGREASRPVDEVLEEIKGLLAQGATDITLLGQNVNSYKPGLDNLLIAIQQFVIHHSSFVIHFLTSHPKDMSDEIIETAAELPYVVKDFILPLQSGDNEVLKKMNRGYTIEYYLGRVRKIRELIPRARISSDLIVGFPGETEEQFQNTLKALELCRFNDVHCFAYSERPMVAAALLPGQVPEEVKRERLQRLIEANRCLMPKIKLPPSSPVL